MEDMNNVKKGESYGANNKSLQKRFSKILWVGNKYHSNNYDVKYSQRNLKGYTNFCRAFNLSKMKINTI